MLTKLYFMLFGEFCANNYANYVIAGKLLRQPSHIDDHSLCLFFIIVNVTSPKTLLRGSSVVQSRLACLVEAFSRVRMQRDI